MNKKLNLAELLSYAGNYKLFTYASCFLAALSSLIAIIPFWYVWKIAGSIIFDADTGNIALYGKIAAISALIAILVYISGLLCSHKAAFRIAANIRIKLLHHIASLPLGTIETLGTGQLRRIIIDTSGMTETYLAHQLPDKYAAIFSSIGLVGLLLWVDWRLALVSLAPIVLGFIVMAFMTGESMRRKIAEYQNALNIMSNEAVEYVRGIPVVKTFGQSIFSFRRFKQSIENYAAWTIAYTQELRMPMMCFTLAVNGSFAFLIAAGVFTAFFYGVSREFLSNFILAVIIAPLISVTLTRTIRQNENEMLSADAMRRINEILSLKPLSVRENVSSANDNINSKNFSSIDTGHSRIAPSIEIANVSFSYGKNKALSSVSINVKPGQTLALVGHSGGGKSTLAKLIARFFDVQAGKIFIGNLDVRDYRPEDLMNEIAFVFQDSKLIHASILDNIKLSKPDASHEEVMNALKLAGCDEIIAKLPDGINTVIGSQGVFLSGGEVQRLTVARAILKNSPVVILDEAAAFADPDNEQKLHDAIKTLAKNKTVILIAHRLSSVKDADIIAVLEKGKLIETGNFEELINLNGKFAQMWKDYQTSLTWNIHKEGK